MSQLETTSLLISSLSKKERNYKSLGKKFQKALGARWKALSSGRKTAALHPDAGRRVSAMAATSYKSRGWCRLVDGSPSIAVSKSDLEAREATACIKQIEIGKEFMAIYRKIDDNWKFAQDKVS